MSHEVLWEGGGVGLTQRTEKTLGTLRFQGRRLGGGRIGEKTGDTLVLGLTYTRPCYSYRVGGSGKIKLRKSTGTRRDPTYLGT